MSEHTWLRRRWKLVINILTLVALTAAIIFSRRQILDTIKNLGHVHAGLLLLLIPVEALNDHAQARLYQGLFAIVGNKLSYKFLYRASLELNFVNHVFPSGGVTGLSFFSLRIRKGKELTGARATLIHLIKVSMYIVAYEVILLFGIVALAAMGRVNNFVMLVASSLSTLLVVGTLMFFYIVGRRERINNFFTGATRGVNWLIHLVRPKYPETINIDQARKVFDDFHDNYQEIKQSWTKLRTPFMYSMLADITEIAAVYVVYMAFGEYVNIGAVILAYGIANFAGLISVLPGGVGIYEGLMTAVLAATGIPPSVSLPVTVMYRLLNTLIQVPPGYYLYHQTIKKGGAAAGSGRSANG